jgi:heparan-alpha-glucosaminide N-acetyltransferase
MIDAAPHTDAMASAPGRATRAASARLTSLDVFRGVTMVFMASEILHLPSVARQFPASGAARFVAGMLDHRAWVGCVPWDLIQPAFMFMVGVSLPYSIASRREKGQSFSRMLAHSAVRALILITLGIFLRSQSRAQTYFTFEDVLTQIGLGYVFLFLLAWTRSRVQLLAAGLILVGYWAAFALYPLPAPGFDTTTVGVRADWPHHLSGFAAHWDKNTNLAARADQWFLNLFPRERPFVYNGGGYLTLNFVPSLATMIFGLLAGGVLRSARAGTEKVRALVAWGVAGIATGAALHMLGLCPIVKRIWTPSWTVFSAGWVVLFLAGYYYVIDLKGEAPDSIPRASSGSRRSAWRAGGWTHPFVVVGANSIAMYVLVHIATDYVTRSLLIHLGPAPFNVFGVVFAPVLLGAGTLALFWLILFWMYRNRVFVRL